MHPTDRKTPRVASITRLAFALLLSAALAACAGAGDADPTGRGEPVVSASAAQSAQPGAISPSTPDASPALTYAPGPSVPQVPALEPPPFASRVSIPALGIDLPVVSGDLQPPPNYPYCDVAAYVTRFNQPYEPGTTYISAHAQRGMFLPLLEASERDDGEELLGMAVEVYVSDGRLFTYTIDRVVRHATDYSAVAEIPLSEQHLVLQTSEGPYGTVEKLQVIAQRSAESMVEIEYANPEPKPRQCEPDSSV